MAQIVADSLEHFHEERYRLIAWVIMGNHVHALFESLMPHLRPICGSWKSFTVNKINKHLGRSGTLWLSETFDRLVRDEDELRNVYRYICANPAKAGLSDWEWVREYPYKML